MSRELRTRLLGPDLDVISDEPATPPWQARYEHEMAAVSEGLCPVHHTALEPVYGVAPDRIAGHCAACRSYWGANLESQEVGWWLDHHPVTGVPSGEIPAYMAVRP